MRRGQRIRLAQIRAEARLGYTVRVRPRRAKTVGHVREDTAWTPRDGGRGSRAEIQLAGGYPVSHDDTGNIVLEVYGRDVPHAMGQNRSKGPTDQLANRYREAPDPISLSLSSLAPALEHTHTRIHSTRGLGPSLPLSPVCNPYFKIEYKSTRARTGRRDIWPEPV